MTAAIDSECRRHIQLLDNWSNQRWTVKNRFRRDISSSVSLNWQST